MSTAETKDPVTEKSSGKDPVEGRLTFPPFPPVPQGVTIVPFKEFKERGIRILGIEEGDDVERDGLGIPTVELHVRHDTDVCKTETKRKRRAKKPQQMSAAAQTPGVRKEWWEQWMDTEDSRGVTGSYNPYVLSFINIHFNVFLKLCAPETLLR